MQKIVLDFSNENNGTRQKTTVKSCDASEV